MRSTGSTRATGCVNRWPTRPAGWRCWSRRCSRPSRRPGDSPRFSPSRSRGLRPAPQIHGRRSTSRIPRSGTAELIDEGRALLRRAAALGDPLGRFQLEAAIQAVHCDRARTGDLDADDPRHAVPRARRDRPDRRAPGRRSPRPRTRLCGADREERVTNRRAMTHRAADGPKMDHRPPDSTGAPSCTRLRRHPCRVVTPLLRASSSAARPRRARPRGLRLRAPRPEARPSAADDGWVTPGKITIATGEPAYYPWVIDDEPESGEGFEAAVAYAVADELGFAADDVVWVRTTFDEAIAPGPKDFDVNLQQFSITDERKQSVDFSSPYYETTQVVVTTGLVARGGCHVDRRPQGPADRRADRHDELHDDRVRDRADAGRAGLQHERRRQAGARERPRRRDRGRPADRLLHLGRRARPTASSSGSCRRPMAPRATSSASSSPRTRRSRPT